MVCVTSTEILLLKPLPVPIQNTPNANIYQIKSFNLTFKLDFDAKYYTFIDNKFRLFAYFKFASIFSDLGKIQIS